MQYSVMPAFSQDPTFRSIRSNLIKYPKLALVKLQRTLLKSPTHHVITRIVVLNMGIRFVNPVLKCIQKRQHQEKPAGI